MNAREPRQSSAKSIYFAAVEIGDDRCRAGFLDDVCQDDSSLRCEVEQLLTAQPANEDLFQRAVEQLNPREADGADSNEGSLGASESLVDATKHPIIDRYKLLEEIGRGGMGTVYMAQQTEPVKRHVALKVINPGMDSREVIARFEAERQALALMDHPNIAHVFDGGTTDRGRPYFVMELVRGLPITDYCQKHKVTLNDRLQLFVTLCQAVQHAHQKGIIHRDLKPSNVQITHRDGLPQVKVIDFGIAKALNHDLTDRTLYTQFSQLVGTPLYMSPEQADRIGRDVDTRSDIYSLGVSLYELLTDTTPFDRGELSEAGVEGARRMICTVEPLRPSVRVGTLQATDDSTLDLNRDYRIKQRKLGFALRGDLDWIVMKALSKDRNKRYESASALAQDIQRHLNSEPIDAKPPTTITKLAKWSHRHRALVSSIAAVACVAVAALSISTAMITRALRQSQNALSQTEIERDKANVARDDAITAKQEARQERDDAVKNLYVAQMRMAQKDWDDGQVARLDETLLGYLPAPGREDLRGWEWYYNLARCRGDLITWSGHDSGEVYVAWCPDGKHIASRAGDGLKIWVANTGEVVASLAEGRGRRGLAWRPDGARIALTFPFQNVEDWKIRIWDFERKQMHLTIDVERQLESVAWGPDGQQISAPGPDSSVMIWDAETGNVVGTLTGHAGRVEKVDWSPDGTHIAATGHESGAITVWNVETGEIDRSIMTDQLLLDLDWHPDGRRLAVGANSGDVVVWDVTTGEAVVSVSEEGHTEELAWSPDGLTLATGFLGSGIKIRSASDGKVVRHVLGHTSPVGSLSWNPDGARLASSAAVVKVWDTAKDTPVQTIATDATRDGTVAFSPSDKHLAYSASDQTIKICDAYTGEILHSMKGLTGRYLRGPCWSADGKRLACGNESGLIAIYDAEAGKLVRQWPHVRPGDPHADDPLNWVDVSWHPDGRQLASFSNTDVTVRIWEADTGTEIDAISTGRRLNTRIGPVVAWSPDGARLAVASLWRYPIQIWDRISHRKLHQIKGVSSSLVWSTDGRYLAASGNSMHASVRIWDTFTGRSAQTFSGHRGERSIVGWSSDSRRIVTVGRDGLRVWNPRTGQEYLSIPDVTSAAWSHDRKKIATVSRGTIRIHDASIGYQVAGMPDYRVRRAQALRSEAEQLKVDGHYERALRSAMLAAEVAAEDGMMQSLCAFDLLTVADKRFRDTERALDFAQLGTKLAPDRSWPWMVLGIAQYRRAAYPKAKRSLMKLVEIDPDGPHPRTSCFLAMTCWHLGETGSARQHFDDATRFIKQESNEDVITLSFRDEAAELLGVDDGKLDTGEVPSK